ncbi:hypothetical protein [Natronosalvus halobius]|uniref:hypothetical protein n=1 Tax=Natronosalvus halobius TaxID=2953746 RepID=UPI0020A04552|nr:hypothetical protein [Natronosalvus halobius]USZ73776.1 hypothetical protein NGM15_18390 [Natronosalvus halobius]
MASNDPLSDLEIREQSLAHTRDALAALQKVPAAGLDQPKHETVTDLVDGATSLERQLANEVEQIRGGDGE